MKKKREKLTRRQAEVLHFIEDFIKKNGGAPTYKEIGEGLGVNDSAAHLTVKHIAEKGYIQQDRRPRKMKVL